MVVLSKAVDKVLFDEELVPYSFSIIHGIAEYVSTRGCQKESPALLQSAPLVSLNRRLWDDKPLNTLD